VLATAATLLADNAAAAPACKNISVEPMIFPDYDVFATTVGRSTTNITYNCPPPMQPPIVSLGRGSAPSFRPRQMTRGAERLSYNLYVDPLCLVVWGDGTGGTVTIPLPVGNKRTWPIYGCLPPQQDVAVGDYVDVITITFDF
jgi:spore coat protein U-like protein